MNSPRYSLRLMLSVLLPAIMLLSSAAQLRLCVGIDHLGLVAENSAEPCCASEEAPAAALGSAIAPAQQDACSDCTDLDISSSQFPVRLQSQACLPMPVLAMVSSAVQPAETRLAPAPDDMPVQSRAWNPVHAGALLRI